MKPILLLIPFLLGPLIHADDRPNFIYILADDMGYGDVQALNPKSKIPTPHLNRMAKEGMSFTDAHSPSAVCTPTRYGVLTGRYCWRSRLKRGVQNGYGTPLIETDRPTVASHLKAAGYHTAVVGKWHLGLGFQKDEGGKWDWNKPLTYSPVDIGFKRSLVIPASLDFPPYVFIEGHEITGKPNRTQPAIGFPGYLREGELGSDFSILDCLDKLTQEACDQIRSRAKKPEPFFLYFPLTAPHKPVLPHPRFEGKSKLGPYGDFIMQVDWTVGEVLKTLDDSGIADNTMVVYTSDNGSFMYRRTDKTEPDHVADETVQAYYQGNHTANGALRGTKADIWEGGHRVPFFVRWPKGVRAGTQCDVPICHVDFYATAAALARTKLPPNTEAAQDSFNMLPLLQENDRKFVRAPVINHSASGMFAVRDGKWKLVMGNGSGGRERPRGHPFQGAWKLFDLNADLAETNDVAAENPEVVQNLQAWLFKMLAMERSR